MSRTTTPDPFVFSDPSPLAKPGATYSYQLEVLSKKGGLNFKLESGPEGLAVSPTGKVTWKAPAKPADSDVDVLVTVSDSSGQEVFHNFRVEFGPR